MQDILALGLLVVSRFAIPVLLIAGAALLLVRQTKAQMQADLQAPPAEWSLTPAQWARAVTAPPVVRCWERKNCDPAKRAGCVAYNRPHVPCWLAVAVVEGQARAVCQGCEMHRLQKREVPYLRVLRGGGAGGRDSASSQSACEGADPN